jgi:hypothetical protein
MFTNKSFTLTLVTLITTWSLAACGAPMMEKGAMADKTMSGQAMHQSTAMTATQSMSSTMMMSDTHAMTESMAMTDTMMMSDTHAMSGTMMMSDTHTMSESMAMPAPMMLHGALVGLGDGQHEGAGMVEIAGKAGAYTLKLNNFFSSEGPDLHVILSKNADPIHDKVGDGWLDLGNLQATSGDQQYALPADTDLGSYKSAVIYCVTYNFVFSAATLQ